MENQINVETIYRKLKSMEKDMVTRGELNSILETIMILSNKDSMGQIRRSEEDIKVGRIKRINSVNEI